MSNIAREKIADIAMAQTGANDEQSWALADAILAALPDMIAPLVWVLVGDLKYRSDHYSVWLHHLSSQPKPVWMLSAPLITATRYSSKEDAQAAANAHHRAAIMAAFNGEAN
jgi:hypothetical protein